MDTSYTEWKKEQIEGLIAFVIFCVMIFYKEELIDVLGSILNSIMG